MDECHKRGIKVIKDIVFNHCGSENFLFRDRPADDWFTYNSVYTPTTYKTKMKKTRNVKRIFAFSEKLVTKKIYAKFRQVIVLEDAAVARF